jgi:tripartite-type tricarboxylate transporter receptor subunit TctC
MAQRRTTGANWLARAAGALLIASSVCASGAESYPAKPLRLVIGFPPGGFVDFTARVVAAPLGVAPTRLRRS